MSTVFETSWNYPDWEQADGLSDAICTGTVDGIQGHLSSSTTNHPNGDQITADANYSGGAGAKGFRHWRGDGTNQNGGGIKFTLPSPLSEGWLRFYMRYQLGFAWTPAGDPLYTKDIYCNVGGNYLIYGIQGGAWGLTDINSPNHAGSVNWVDLMGGNTGDGQWHCHEFHWKKNNPNSELDIWIDGVQTLHSTGLTLNASSISEILVGSNQTEVTGAGASDYYTDYDDIAVSDSGYIGPLSGGGGAVIAGRRAMNLYRRLRQ